jgi:hypothetical protein
MEIPNTPEELFEKLSDSSIREIFPNFDKLLPTQRKIVQIFHTELTKGELSDQTFLQTITLVTHLWGCYNRTACMQIEQLIESNSEIEAAWIHASTDYARVNQFIESCVNLYDAAPDCTELNGGENTYHLRYTGSS